VSQKKWKIDFARAMLLQRKPLNVITDNVIIRLMSSNWPSFVKSQITLSKVFYRRRRFAYCYHSDNVITFCLSQNDHIKRLPLYLLFLVNRTSRLRLLPLMVNQSFFFQSEIDRKCSHNESTLKYLNYFGRPKLSIDLSEYSWSSG
jgi:hypothetical protein